MPAYIPNLPTDVMAGETDIPTVYRLEMVNEPETQTQILIQHFEDRPPFAVRLTAGALFVLGALVFHRGNLH